MARLNLLNPSVPTIIKWLKVYLEALDTAIVSGRCEPELGREACELLGASISKLEQQYSEYRTSARAAARERAEELLKKYTPRDFDRKSGGGNTRPPRSGAPDQWGAELRAGAIVDAVVKGLSNGAGHDEADHREAIWRVMAEHGQSIAQKKEIFEVLVQSPKIKVRKTKAGTHRYYLAESE